MRIKSDLFFYLGLTLLDSSLFVCYYPISIEVAVNHAWTFYDIVLVIKTIDCHWVTVVWTNWSYCYDRTLYDTRQLHIAAQNSGTAVSAYTSFADGTFTFLIINMADRIVVSTRNRTFLTNVLALICLDMDDVDESNNDEDEEFIHCLRYLK